MPMMEVDLEISDGWPAGIEWEELTDQAIRATVQTTPELAISRLSVSILFAGDEVLQTLNREWRGKDRPTNVLSFPMLTRDELLALGAKGPPVMLGDLALSHDTCAREAGEKGIALVDHASHLIVHGLLHLAGYDHETGDENADEMERLEINTLALMGIANPYGGSEEL